MDTGLILIAAGYVLFLLLSSGIIAGAAKALTGWGRSSVQPPRATTSS